MVGCEEDEDDMPLAKRQKLLYEGRMASEAPPKKADATERRHSDSSEVIVLVSDSDDDNAAAPPPPPSQPQQPRKKTLKQPAKPVVPPPQPSQPLEPPKKPREPPLPKTSEAKRPLVLKPLAQLKRPRESPSKPTKTISRDVPLKPLPGIHEFEFRPVQKPGQQQKQIEALPPPPPLPRKAPPPPPPPARVIEEVIIDDSSSDEVEVVSFLPGMVKKQQQTEAAPPAPTRPTLTTTNRPIKPPSPPPHEEGPTLFNRNGQALPLQPQALLPPPQPYPPTSAPAAASGPFSTQRIFSFGAPATTISRRAYATASTAPYSVGGSGGGKGGLAPEFRSREAATEFRNKFRVNPTGVGGSMPSYTFSNKGVSNGSRAGGSGSVKPRAAPANGLFTKAAMEAHAKEILHDMTRPARQAMRKSQDAWNHAAMKWREKNRPSEEEVQRRQQEDAARHHENAKFRQANGGNAPWTRPLGGPPAGPGPSRPAPPPQGPLPPAPPTDAPELEWRSYFRNLSQRKVTSAASFLQVLRAFGVECAGPDKVKDAYRQAVRMYHPDSNSKERVWSTPQEKVRAEEVMKIINERKIMETQR